jgi:hypothetical protein
MIELLKLEEQKKAGGIGVAKAARLPGPSPQVHPHSDNSEIS